jgi:hypothetical protein
MSIKVILLGVACACFLLKGFNVVVAGVDLMNIGFAAVVASFLFG